MGERANESPYPPWLATRERDAIADRRAAAGVDDDGPTIGLALSGGGIRSATFCLGVLQALARADLLRRVDYLSTVSGGGYVGAFLGAMHVRPRTASREPGAVPKEVAASLTASPDSFPIRWLRENGRYLAPNGAGASWLAGAILLRNWAAVVVVLVAFAATMSFATELAHWGVNHLRADYCTGEPWKHLWVVVGKESSPLFLAPIAVLGALGVPAGIAYWLVPASLDRDGKLRHRVSSILKLALVVVALLAGVALCDALGKLAYEKLRSPGPDAVAHGVAAFYGAVVAVVMAGNRVLALLGSTPPFARKSIVPLVTSLGAFALIVLGGSIVSTATHALVWSGARSWDAAPIELYRALFGFSVAGIVTCVLGAFYGFVNESSLSSFYAARLTRAYLGASNPERRTAAPGTLSTTEPVEGDDLAMPAYAPHARGGPLHLVNVTLNETLDPRVQVKQPDRHGLPLAIGPCGVSVSVKHHALRDDAGDVVKLRNGAAGEARAFEVFPRGRTIAPDSLGLGEWIALSGAAVAPGLGARTRLGNSMLLTLFNLRLGYWWGSGIDPSERAHATPFRPATRAIALGARIFPVYGFLFGELLARFPGTAARHWYLSDGGHFENTGCYELLRRELPILVCCDAGADPAYQMDDLANLVRVARVDFGAEITFLSGAELGEALGVNARRFFGELDELGRAEWKATHEGDETPHAALARVTYRSGKRGLLVVLKPTLCQGEPHDVRNYGASHEDFPQETTADQFFDDAQWEAYRRLGDHIASCVFGATRDARDPWTAWVPRELGAP